MKLFTSSYDGSVRMLDPHAGQFTLVLTDQEAEFSALDMTADGHTGYVGDYDGNLEAFDVRMKKAVQEGVNIYPKKVNTVHVSARLTCCSHCSGSFAGLLLRHVVSSTTLCWHKLQHCVTACPLQGMHVAAALWYAAARCCYSCV